VGTALVDGGLSVGLRGSGCLAGWQWLFHVWQWLLIVRQWLFGMTFFGQLVDCWLVCMHPDDQALGCSTEY
jgi:hypothetical protein